MNLNQASSYRDAVLLLLACTLSSFLLFTAMPPLVLQVGASTIAFVHRRTRAATCNIDSRNTLLLGWFAFLLWVAWGLACAHGTQYVSISIAYSLGLSLASLYVCFRGSHLFTPERARQMGAAFLIAGLMPVGFPATMFAVLVRAWFFTALLFGLFFSRIEQNLAINLQWLFCSSYWVLACPPIPALIFAIITLVFLALRFAMEFGKEDDEDIANPQASMTAMYKQQPRLVLSQAMKDIQVLDDTLAAAVYQAPKQAEALKILCFEEV
jgi:hypothetical protein